MDGASESGAVAVADGGATAMPPIDVPVVTLADIEAARDRIAAYLPRTPLFSTETLSKRTGTRLSLKAENLQKTGSFKVRGALNSVLQLTAEQRARGIVTMSAGNHGAGVAYAASLVGVRCAVFMPESGVPAKIAAIRGYGAEVHFAPNMQALKAAMETHRDTYGMEVVHPFADPNTIAGQGTVGLEILEDCPDVEAIVVGTGGGGLLSGVAQAVSSMRPDVRIVGVEPVGAPTVYNSLKAGKPLPLDHIDTIADGLAAPFSDLLPQSIIERCVADVVLVTDDEIIDALRLILERTKLLVEPAGAAAVAALLTGKAGIETGSRTVAILSGGNIDLEGLRRVL
jgi:threonine dehydratase